MYEFLHSRYTAGSPPCIKGNREIVDQHGHKHAPEDRLNISDKLNLFFPVHINTSGWPAATVLE